MTVVVQSSSDTCQQAGQRLACGDLVAFPTETVYGLGGNALNARSVAGIFEAKGRPSFNPLIVHVPDLTTAERYAVFSDVARNLAQAFWPGPLTMVLPRKVESGICDLVSAGLPTIAIRVPAHPIALDILKSASCPVAAPSANPSGRISPTCADHVFEGLNGRVQMIVDGGACAIGIESTVLDVTSDTLCILRPGGVTAAQIGACVGRDVTHSGGAESGQPLHSPGMLSSHYAPNIPVRLNVDSAADGEALLGFGPVDGADLNLSPVGDLKEAATNLFAMLRSLDAQNFAGISVSPIPENGLGLAINDRLRRAAAPRP